MTPGRPVRFLASVTTDDEARLAVSGGADIVDCKDPNKGALGALPYAAVRAIRAAVPRHIPVSATVGDLPAEPDLVARAVSAMAKAGVDFVKIGLFPGGDARATIARLGALPLGPVRLVGLLLADRDPDLALVADMGLAAFAGVMLDTADKASGSLPDAMGADALAGFIASARAAGVFAGLAGSLRLAQIPNLVSLGPDILGFRGALCANGRRTAALDEAALARVRRAIPRAPPSALLPPPLEDCVA